MQLLTVVGLGACGGAVVQIVAFCGRLQAWQSARLHARSAEHSPLPRLTSYIDPLADILVLFTRLGLGGLAAGVFHAQISGATAAVAVGAAAPALLRQLVTARDLVSGVTAKGTDAPPAASDSAAGLELPPVRGWTDG